MKKLCKHVFIAALRFVALEHDMIADELFHKKSVSALIWLISQGRELEAAYQNESIFISEDKSKNKVSIWINRQESLFNSMEKLLQFAEIKGHKLIDVWDEIHLDTLF